MTFQEDMKTLKEILDDYRKTGNPDLLQKLRGYISKYANSEKSDPAIDELKEMFHL